jgi:hypothetical protein
VSKIDTSTEAPVTLTYTNWKGETAQRRIIPRRIWFGSTAWHPEPQWILTALDVDKDKERHFALKDFGQPITVQDAARALLDADGCPNERLCEIADEIHGAGASMNRAIGAALRAIAEGRA